MSAILITIIIACTIKAHSFLRISIQIRQTTQIRNSSVPFLPSMHILKHLDCAKWYDSLEDPNHQWTSLKGALHHIFWFYPSKRNEKESQLELNLSSRNKGIMAIMSAKMSTMRQFIINHDCPLQYLEICVEIHHVFELFVWCHRFLQNEIWKKLSEIPFPIGCIILQKNWFNSKRPCHWVI